MVKNERKFKRKAIVAIRRLFASLMITFIHVMLFGNIDSVINSPFGFQNISKSNALGIFLIKA
ncbi:hypothetical protein WU67_01290 [Lactiplantibacillus plantarum]|nr:hypothetical protein AZF39_01138 [Lactiplantibacillus plantarum]ARW14150.1 hypothetical protein S100434_02023 [Lactiplantibacillus plantarum subsp. plantarum]KLD43281.1 hypothetical protein WU67_01290 [Lactiplantibacillus plantarum]QHM22785.1 hypothetical protein C7M31_02278 [Lactiplantibacillus plantarum]QHM24276.1 hypothetical protein C7M32_00777 [Lactiplantibacillus plantarum]